MAATRTLPVCAATNSVSLAPRRTLATFLKVDAATQGNWKGTYGVNGYDVIGDTPSRSPSYATVTTAGNSTYTWRPARPRSPHPPESQPEPAIAGTWYATNSFTVNVNLTDGQTHDLELYFLDWDSTARSETVQISNATNGAVLNTETVSSFHNGVYLNYQVSGHIVITITKVTGANAVLSGLFFDPDPPAPATASAVGLSIGSQGVGIGTDNNMSTGEMGTVNFNSNGDTTVPLSVTDTHASARKVVHDVALEQLRG